MQTVINGAQLFYTREFNISNTWLQGLINAAPYLTCALLSCWLTEPLNKLFGRRGTIFFTCCIEVFASIWEALCQSWYTLLIARFVLGLGIGAKSATVPVYIAEVSPVPIRGALTMLWQTFTAFGILLGFIMDVLFINVHDYLNWRLMLGSTMVVPIVICFLVFFGAESPRWLVKKKRYANAFYSLLVSSNLCLLTFQRLRPTAIQAARDLYSMYTNFKEEEQLKLGKNLYLELVTVPRNYRATIAAFIVMFMQQFCGINIIMYFSSQIFVATGVSETTAIYSSLGAGVLNFLFALPSIKIIDTWGRRPLLLSTLPLMSACLLFTGFSFWIHDETVRLAMVAVGIYLFVIAYSPGQGPVPFVYAAEAFPLYIRDVGMSFASATTWFFSFVLTLLWPSMLHSFTPQGAFGWYAGWCLLGWIIIYFVLPETKGKTLEELDSVFSVPIQRHAQEKLELLRRKCLPT
jgi:sugar porter (SP) family MFS transporter